MSLAPSERQALAEIEQSLSTVDPKLAARMATFARLAQGDSIARWKSLSPWRLWLRRIAIVAIALVIVGLFIFAVLHAGASASATNTPGVR
jgi:Protein of unknown function (DUF3040)